ncbi:hypothetical protein [Candidatus Nitronereus thalassa]|uniref:Uncharacterized protein n=1 Tax=Candidatus Nitronereus thalassa TaxID=3020898 RepID=A0ABU3K3C1_9BACT|nr:hypothetical protein [Candidatus Nitronereus thalassa]MDT7040871.1 hypothetical protein [Candidatus Nitronereus thalassa]
MNIRSRSTTTRVLMVMTAMAVLAVMPMAPTVVPDRADVASHDMDLAPSPSVASMAPAFDGALLRALGFENAAYAATDNPSTGSAGYILQTFQYQGQLSSSVANKSTWKAPWPMRLIDIKCSIRDLDLTTTDETYTFTLQEGAGTVATCAPTADATEVSGTITAADVADEAVLTIDYAGGGTTPLADDVTIILVWKRQ